jgi:hypothetical protein
MYNHFRYESALPINFHSHFYMTAEKREMMEEKVLPTPISCWGKRNSDRTDEENTFTYFIQLQMVLTLRRLKHLKVGYTSNKWEFLREVIPRSERDHRYDFGCK